jgi:DNA primase
MEYTGLAYPDAIRELAQQVGMEVPEVRGGPPAQAASRDKGLAERMLQALSYYRAELRKSPEAVDYLKGRGLSGEIAARYGLGYAPDAWQSLKGVFPDYEAEAMKDTGLVIDSEAAEGREGEPARKARRYDRFRGRVMFPILDSRGNVIGFGGRIIGEAAWALTRRRRRAEGRESTALAGEEGRPGGQQVIVVRIHGCGGARAARRQAVATWPATTPVHVGSFASRTTSFPLRWRVPGARRPEGLEVSLPVWPTGKRRLPLPAPGGRPRHLRAPGGRRPSTRHSPARSPCPSSW